MTYLSREVLDIRPDFAPGVEHGQLDDHVYDSQSGGFAIPWKSTTRPKRTLRLPFVFEGLEEIKAFRSFFAGRDGRRLGFWVPTYLTDNVVLDDYAAGIDEIDVSYTGLASKLALSSQFRHIAIITSGKMELYRIESSVPGSTWETLTLDRGLDTAVDASATVCCGLLFARLADDTLEFDYISGEVVRCQPTFVELPPETDGTEHEGSQPLFLYRFTRGATVWRFTNWPISVTVGSVEWDTMDIEQSELTEDSEFNLDPLSIVVSTDDTASLFRTFLDVNLSERTTVEIFESDYATLTADLTSPLYKGEISKCNFREKGAIDVECTSIFRVGEHETPRTKLQRTCNHRLYNARCGLIAGLFTTTGPITAISSSPPYIEGAEFGAKATLEGDANWFALGKVLVGTETRFCVGASGNRLYLNAPFRSAIVGNQASALAGCDKRISTCENKFLNTANFRGWPYTPNKNPQFEALEAPKPSGGKK